MKSRLSYSSLVVLSSGKPSKNVSFPIGVSTESGVVISAGISVVIFIFGGVVCADAVPATQRQPKRTAQTTQLTFERSVFIFAILLISCLTAGMLTIRSVSSETGMRFADAYSKAIRAADEQRCRRIEVRG